MEIKQRTIINFFLLLFLFLEPLIFNPWGYNMFNPPKLVLFYHVFFLTFFFSLFSWGKEDFKLFGSPSFFFLILLTFVLIIATFTSLHFPTSFFGQYSRYEGLTSWLGYFWLAFCGYYFLSDKDNLNKLIWLVPLSLLLVSIYGIVQHFGLDFIRWAQSVDITRSRSTFGNASYLGAYLALFLPIIFSFLFKTQSKETKILAFISFLVGMACLFFTDSRGAWVGLIGGLLFFSLLWKLKDFKRFFEQRRIFLLIPALFIIVTSLFAFFSWSLRKYTVSGRFIIWKESLKIIADRPISGWGLDSFQMVFPRYLTSDFERWYGHGVVTDKAHNFLLDFSASAGLFFLLFFLALMLYFFIRGWITVPIARENGVLISGILAGTLSYLLTLLFHFSTIEVSSLFWFILGVGFYLLEQDDEAIKKPVQLFNFPKNSLLFAIFPLGLLLIFLLFPPSLSLVGDYHLRQASIALSNEDLPRMVSHLTFSEKVYPLESEYSLIKGKILTEIVEQTKELTYFNQAEQSLQRVALLNPHNEYTYLYLGDLFYSKGKLEPNSLDIEKAVKYYKLLLLIDSNYSLARYKLSLAYASLGRLEEALGELMLALRLKPRSLKYLIEIGKVCEEMGKKEEAIRYYQKALKLDPQNPFLKQALLRLR